MKIISLVGARPQFIKEAVLNSAVRESSAWEHIVVHSGQHYDENMSNIFFDELGIIPPKYNLNIGSGNHGEMTARALSAFEEILIEERPDITIVYGDTNTTLAGALAAVKLKIPVAHIEAGLRQQPCDMPEEINRVLTDRISKWLFCCSGIGVRNLKKEGITSGVHMVGDIMYDLYLRMQSKFNNSVLDKLKLKDASYILVTLHRDFNVDIEDNLRNILNGIFDYSRFMGLKVVFSIHPRTRMRIDKFGMKNMISKWILIEPVGYLELMGLLENSVHVITDSGGLQKEAWYAKKRAAVIMPDTSWRELTDCGWNILIQADDNNFSEKLKQFVSVSTSTTSVEYPVGIYGDGNTAKKIISELSKGTD
jgi:UDP-N-acetylglucosamine 2-epimerase (non-hydrolysing)